IAQPHSGALSSRGSCWRVGAAVNVARRSRLPELARMLSPTHTEPKTPDASARCTISLAVVAPKRTPRVGRLKPGWGIIVTALYYPPHHGSVLIVEIFQSRMGVCSRDARFIRRGPRSRSYAAGS